MDSPPKKFKTNSGESVSMASPSAENSSNADNASTSVTDPGVTSSSTPMDIDESLYSRQLYVLGHDAMRSMAASDILISGLGGLGVEVAKNVILGGVKSVTLHDTKNCTMQDLSSQFYLSEGDIGKNRSEASYGRLAELNSYVQTKVCTSGLTDEFITSFSVVVLTDNTLDEQLRVSALTHNNGIPLVVASTKGLFGQIFCDFGENFRVIDTNGESPMSAMVANISKGTDSVVSCMEDSSHGLEDGDFVTFSGVQGMTELNGSEPKQVRVVGPTKISIGDTTSYSDYICGGVISQVKMTKTLNFKPLDVALKDPNFVITDYGKVKSIPQLHLAFKALHRFEAIHGRSPRSQNIADSQYLVNIANTINVGDGSSLEIDLRFFEDFCRVSSGNICPMNAVIGGIVAQEVMKACSGKFMPIYQWLYFDASECMPESNEVLESDFELTHCRYDGQVAVFGKDFQSVLGSLKYFVVGAGAIGCELLKNFAMMGVGSGENGRIILTDMDLIERSNLNRQFLFRPQDLQKPKSGTAAEAIRCMNPNVHILSHEIMVGRDTENVFNDEFFEGLDGVANALDNVEARLYVDRRCVDHRKPLLETGTQGTKGSTQVVVPFKSESYGSSYDPPEKSYPTCTIKTFPNRIEHTLQWAREEFEELFQLPARNARQYLTDPDFLDRIVTLPGDQQPVAVLTSVKKALVDERPETFNDCLSWARNIWQCRFSNQIRQLLVSFPPDHLNTSGKPFWSGPKKCPNPLQFSTDNTLHLDYIFAAANLKAQVYGITQNRNRSELASLVQNIHIPEFEPVTNCPHPVNEANEMLDGSDEEIVARFLSLVADQRKMEQDAEESGFELDDSVNSSHDEDDTAFDCKGEKGDLDGYQSDEQNLDHDDDYDDPSHDGDESVFDDKTEKDVRDENHSEEQFPGHDDDKFDSSSHDEEGTPSEYLTVEEVLGEIPPRYELQNVTINLLEFEKDDDSNLHMDFIVAAANLRAINYGITPADRHTSKLIAGNIIPSIATTTSVVAGLASLELYKLAQGCDDLGRFKNGFLNLALPFIGFSEPLPAPRLGDRWSMWDRFEVTGELTLKEFIDHFENEHGLQVTMLSHGFTSLHCSYSPIEDRMHLPISHIVQQVSKRNIEPHVKALTLEIMCNDSEGNDVDVPTVRYTLPTNHAQHT